MKRLCGLFLGIILIAAGLFGCGDYGPAPDPDEVNPPACDGTAPDQQGRYHFVDGAPIYQYSEYTPVGGYAPSDSSVVLVVKVAAKKGPRCHDIWLTDLPLWVASDFPVEEVSFYSDVDDDGVQRRIGGGMVADQKSKFAYSMAMPLKADEKFRIIYVRADTRQAKPGQGISVRMQGPAHWTVDGEWRVYSTNRGFPFDYKTLRFWPY